MTSKQEQENNTSPLLKCYICGAKENLYPAFRQPKKKVCEIHRLKDIAEKCKRMSEVGLW